MRASERRATHRLHLPTLSDCWMTAAFRSPDLFCQYALLGTASYKISLTVVVQSFGIGVMRSLNVRPRRVLRPLCHSQHRSGRRKRKTCGVLWQTTRLARELWDLGRHVCWAGVRVRDGIGAALAQGLSGKAGRR